MDFGPTGSDPREPAPGAGVPRAEPAVPLHSGGEDTEHANSHIVQDWDDTQWYEDLPRTVTPVIGGDVTSRAGDKPKRS